MPGWVRGHHALFDELERGLDWGRETIAKRRCSGLRGRATTGPRSSESAAGFVDRSACGDAEACDVGELVGSRVVMDGSLPVRIEPT